jgi:large subunit ribosomal protein L24
MRILKYRKTRNKRSQVRHAINSERVPMPVTKGDTVRVMRGEDKGKDGEVVRVFLKTGRVLVCGVNIVKRHRKARRPEEQSGIIESEAPIALSNVMLLVNGQPTRTKARVNADGTKERVSAKGGEVIPRNR